MPQFLFRWKSPNPNIEQDLAAARTELIKLRHELQTKQTQVGGLKLALQQRHETIDTLNGKLEQARAQCRKLDEEAECYAAMIQRGPLREQYSRRSKGPITTTLRGRGVV